MKLRQIFLFDQSMLINYKLLIPKESLALDTAASILWHYIYLRGSYGKNKFFLKENRSLFRKTHVDLTYKLVTKTSPTSSLF